MMTQRPSILVGCDGSPESKTALDWAVAHARATSGSLRLVAVWDWPTWQGEAVSYGPWDPKDSCRSALDRLRADISFPPDRLSADVVHGQPGRVLVEGAREADMLVVGTHGLGAVERLVLGSVSAHCALRSPVPVVVVRPPTDRRGVLVGVDDSAGARAALRWAMDYADLVGQPLVAMNIVELPAPPVPGGYPVLVANPRADLHREVRSWLDELVEKEQAERGLPVRCGYRVKVADGNPGHVLVEQSKRAGITVCGRRGAGGFRRLVMGSAATALAHHGHSSLVVIPAAR